MDVFGVPAIDLGHEVKIRGKWIFLVKANEWIFLSLDRWMNIGT